MRLGQAESAQHVAARERPEPLRLLRVVGPGHQDRADRAVVDADHGGGGAVAGGDLLEDDRQRQVVEPGAVPLGGHRHAVAAERRQAAQLGSREVAVLVPARACGAISVLHVGAHGVLHGAVVFTEQHGVAPVSTSRHSRRAVGLSSARSRCARRATRGDRPRSPRERRAGPPVGLTSRVERDADRAPGHALATRPSAPIERRLRRAIRPNSWRARADRACGRVTASFALGASRGQLRTRASHRARWRADAVEVPRRRLQPACATAPAR